MKLLRHWTTTTMAILGLTLSSCSPDKARAIRVGAIQFRNESFSCVDSVNLMRQRELEPAPRTLAEIQQGFAENLWELNQNNLQQLAEEGNLVSFLRDPNSTELSAGAENAWKGFLLPVKEQYSAFAAIFDDLERGNFLAADAVGDSIQSAEKLTVQMAGIAQSVVDNPPQMIQYRTRVSSQLIDLKEEYQNLEDISTSDPAFQLFRDRAIELLGAWEQVESLEQELLVTTVTPCLKAASLGNELLPLIRSYDDLDLDTINSFIATVLNQVGLLSQQDFSTVTLKIENVIADIKSDEDMRVSVSMILDEINREVRGRNPNSGDAEAISTINFWEGTVAEAEIENIYSSSLPQPELATVRK